MARALDKLIAKVARGPHEANPEDVLALVANPLPGDAATLRRLAVESGWTDYHRDVAGRIPMDVWADAVATFLERGAQGSVSAARERRSTCASHAAVLAAAGTVDAALAIVELCHSFDDDPYALGRCLGELNNILCFRIKRAPQESAGLFRDYLHHVIASTADENQLASAYLALRACGDESSLTLLEARPDLAAPWDTVRKAAIRGLRKALRGRA